MKINLKKLIKDAGGPKAVADKLGTTKQIVSSWVNVTGKVPPKWVNALSDVTGVPRHLIRPDIFPRSKEKEHDYSQEPEYHRQFDD